MELIALLVFILVQILFLPFAIIGFLLIFYKQVVGSKMLGVSFTAVEVLNGRWTMAIFGMRQDVASTKLIHALPNSSTLGLWMMLFPNYLRYKISGKNKGYPSMAKRGEEGIQHIVFSRTVCFDKIINKSKDKVEQFVIMGAGFDTRCYGELKNSNLKFFELDQASTQKLKIKSLTKAGLDTSNVTYVEVDFSTEHWYEKLENAGYNPSKKTMFLWEGVSLYLTEENVRNTIKEIKEHSGTGSILVADLYSESVVNGTYMFGMKISYQALKFTGEKLIFGLDFSSDYENVLIKFIDSNNTKVGDTYFMGYKTKKGTFMVVAEIEI